MSVINQVASFLSTSHRALNFTFKADSLDADAFKVIDFSVEEGLSNPFTIKLSLASTNQHLSESDVVDQNGLLSLYRNNQLERYFHGVVFAFTKGNTGRHHTFYEITMVPAFSRLSLRTNARIFQNKTVMDITEALLGEMGITNYALAIRHTHEAREFCVQYSESDLAFIERLLAEEGIFYYFEHEKDKHTLIFADDNSVVDELPFPCLYNNSEGGLAESSCIRSLTHRAKVGPTEATLKDYSFKQPSASFLNNASGKDMDYQQQNYEHYMYPGRFKDNGVGRVFSKTRIDYLRRDAKTIQGKGDIAQIISGYTLKISDHPVITQDKRWLVTHVRHEGTQPQSLGNEGTEGATTYHNVFYALPYEQQWKPEPEPKPRIYGSQIATVVGPKSEEIYTDEFGRVKVQFPWDRYGKSDEESSCWIRVAQAGAGPGYGNVVIPRIGHEVVVSFVEGDPDQPLVTGVTFNARNMETYQLPEHKTRTIMRSKTHKGEGFNEITFEDKTQGENLFIHAQKDQTTRIRNNQTTRIDQHEVNSVGGSRSVEVFGNQKHEVRGSMNLTVGGSGSSALAMITQLSSLAQQTSKLLLKASDIASKSDDPELKSFAASLASSALGFLDTDALQNRKGVNKGTNPGRDAGTSLAGFGGKLGEKIASVFSRAGVMNTIVGAFKSDTIAGTYVEQVGISKVSNIGMAEITNIGKEQQVSVGKTIRVKSGDLYDLESKDRFLGRAKKWFINAEEKIILSAPGGQIEINSKGIIIKGLKIDIKGNSINFSEGEKGKKTDLGFAQDCSKK